MAHDLSIQLPGDPTFAPLAVRLLEEAAALPKGPDEEIIERLVPVFETLVGRLLTSLRDEPGARQLAVGLNIIDEGLDLTLAIPGSTEGTPAASLLANDDPALLAARGVFGSVDVVAGGSGLEIRLTVGATA